MRPDRALAGLAAALPEPLTLVDVGVRWGFEARWMQFTGARLVGFDADEDECRVLRQRHAHVPRARFEAVALSDRAGEATLHVAEEPASSSLLEPDAAVIARRRGMASMREVRRTTVATTTLADWAEHAGVGRIDALKLDVQGAELAVLRGAGALLERVRAVDLEVEFNPLYVAQPLFADIDEFMRANGFALWRLGELTHYALPGAGRGGTMVERQTFGDGTLRQRVGGGQLVWGRARYVRASVPDPPTGVPWDEELRDALAAWALQLDDVALVALRRAAVAYPPAAAALARLDRAADRASRLRTLRQRDWGGAAARFVRVTALAARGYEDDRIAHELGLSAANVRLLRRAAPWVRS